MNGLFHFFSSAGLMPWNFELVLALHYRPGRMLVLYDRIRFNPSPVRLRRKIWVPSAVLLALKYFVIWSTDATTVHHESSCRLFFFCTLLTVMDIYCTFGSHRSRWGSPFLFQFFIVVLHSPCPCHNDSGPLGRRALVIGLRELSFRFLCRKSGTSWGGSHMRPWHHTTYNLLSDVHTPVVFIGSYSLTALTTRLLFVLTPIKSLE